MAVEEFVWTVCTRCNKSLQVPRTVKHNIECEECRSGNSKNIKEQEGGSIHKRQWDDVRDKPQMATKPLGKAETNSNVIDEIADESRPRKVQAKSSVQPRNRRKK